MGRLSPRGVLRSALLIGGEWVRTPTADAGSAGSGSKEQGRIERRAFVGLGKPRLKTNCRLFRLTKYCGMLSSPGDFN
jgi:hypothetical protein